MPKEKPELSDAMKKKMSGKTFEKKPIIGTKEGLIQSLRQIGGMYLLNDKEKSIYRMSDLPNSEMQYLCHEMIETNEVESVWTGEKDDLFVIPELTPYYQAIYGIDEKLSKEPKLKQEYRRPQSQ